MTLELVDESDVRKAGNKEKKPELKPELRLVEESDIKKIWSEKKSWLDIVNESDVREDPNIELVNESDIREDPNIELVNKSDVRVDPKIELVSKSDVRKDHKVGDKVKKPELEFVAKERIVNCERQRVGLTNNCAICKELTIDRFNRCPNKYGGF